MLIEVRPRATNEVVFLQDIIHRNRVKSNTFTANQQQAHLVQFLQLTPDSDQFARVWSEVVAITAASFPAGGKASLLTVMNAATA